MTRPRADPPQPNTPPTGRTYTLATIGDFGVWCGITKQGAWQHTRSRWFTAAQLARIGNGAIPVWSAYEAACCFTNKGVDLPGLPEQVLANPREREDFPPLCGVAEISNWTMLTTSGAGRMSLQDWFPQPVDCIAATGLPVWDVNEAREALHDKGYVLGPVTHLAHYTPSTARNPAIVPAMLRRR